MRNWFVGKNIETGAMVRGLRLPGVGVEDDLTCLHNLETRAPVVVWTESLIEIPAGPRTRHIRVWRGSRPERYGMTRSWQRELGGKLYSFSAVIMPDGERRYFANRFNGYVGGPLFGCAWDRCFEATVPGAGRPVCVTCDAEHDVIGTCSTCGHLVYRDCEGDLLHVDYADRFTRKHGEHVATIEEED
jgi:hypothetical protein